MRLPLNPVDQFRRSRPRRISSGNLLSLALGVSVGLLFMSSLLQSVAAYTAPAATSATTAPVSSIGARTQLMASGDRLVRLPGHVLPALARATALAPKNDAASAAEANQPLTLTVVLKRDDQQGFERYLRAVYDPHSPFFHHFLTQPEIAQNFGPSRAAYESVQRYLRGFGFELLEGSSNRLTLTMRGTRTEAEQAFAVQIGGYRLDKRFFYANGQDPSLPTQIASSVQAVAGLSNLSEPRIEHGSFVQYAPLLNGISATKGCVSSDIKKAGASIICGLAYFLLAVVYDLGCLTHLTLDCSLVPLFPGGTSTLGLSGYSAPANDAAAPAIVDGNGQTIGLVEFDSFNVSDVRDFLALTGAKATISQLKEIKLNGGAPIGSAESEVLLDIDTAMMLAPGANVDVYSAPFSGPGVSFQTVFNQMINDKVTVISNSWAYCEDQTSLADVQSIDSILQNAAVAGISVFNGSGDTGSRCLDGSADTVAVPADSPNASAVGGSSATPGPGGFYQGETWWNGSGNTPPTGQGGFGLSKFFSAAAYQTALSGKIQRSVPDVVVNADPAANGVMICQADAGGCPTGLLYGGTSVAAPIWAAFTANLNQAQGHNLGLLNSLIYPLSATSAFHSAVSLKSDFFHVGLGSPNLSELNLELAKATAGPASATVSQVGTISANAPSNGSTPGFVQVQLRDARGSIVSGKTVVLTANSGASAKITPPSGVADPNNGAVSFEITNTLPETVTLTATDSTDSLKLAQSPSLTFTTPPATSAGLDALPAAVTADGHSKATITVMLKDSLGRPTPGKLIQISQGPGHSVIKGPIAAVTNTGGQIVFTAVDQVDENVTYSATDVTDGNLPFPATATVSFISGPNNGCGTPNPVAAPGYQVTPYATGFLEQRTSFLGIVSGCAGAFGMAFDAHGNLFISDQPTGNIYKFPPGGGVAGPSTLLTKTAIGPFVIGLVINKTGNLFVGRNATTAALATGVILQVDPSTGDTLREVASDLTCPALIALDPISGDIFADDNCSGDGLDNPSLWRISDPDSIAPKTTLYATLPTTPNGTEAFAPDGTQYVLLGDSQVAEVSATSGPSPATVSVVPSFTIGPLGLLANGTRPGGGAQTLIGNFAAFGNVPSGVGIYDLTISPPSLSTTLLTDNSFMVGLIQGPDGCLYGAQGDAVFKITDNTGACKYAPATQPATLTLTPTNVSPNPAQGTSQTFTASFHYTTEPEGTPIFFQVNGANPQVKIVHASGGEASFSYTALFAGVDTITASAMLGTSTLTSNQAVVNWTTGTHSSFLTLNLSPITVAVGKPVTLLGSLSDVSVTPPAPVTGASVQFSLEGSSCFGTTDTKGTASCTLTPSVAEIATLTASFAGNPTLTPATTTIGFNVTAPPTTIPTFTPRPSATATSTLKPTATRTPIPTPFSTHTPVHADADTDHTPTQPPRRRRANVWRPRLSRPSRCRRRPRCRAIRVSPWSRVRYWPGPTSPSRAAALPTVPKSTSSSARPPVRSRRERSRPRPPALQLSWWCRCLPLSRWGRASYQ